ncbi:Nn.00g024150.m01.CDS01 [Neocucurbitaria sp. VM-36]
MPAVFNSCLPLRKVCSRFASFWSDSQRQAWNDVRSRWRRGAFWFLFASLCACLGLLYLNPYFSLRSSFRTSACLPDGSFRIDPESYEYWSRSGFFQITLGFGTLTFTQAKAIDIIWDVVFGRGGQALIALVSWQVFAKYLTVSMETAPVSFLTYRTVFLQDQSLVVAIPRIIRDFSFRLRLKSKAAMFFMITTMTFILAFPTFGSAMTGYSGNVKPFVPDQSGNFVPFESFQFLLYVIHDGWRINKTGKLDVSYGQYYSREPVFGPYDIYRFPPCHFDSGLSPEVWDMCFMLGNVSQYVGEHGFFGYENESSVFNGIELPPPVLNISAFYLPAHLNGSGWVDPRTHESLFTNSSQMSWTSSNQTYDYSHIKDQGTCQAVESYQWGFSFIQLNFMIISLLIWAIGIFTMWLKTHFIMKRRGQRDVAGEYKAVLELADAMHAQIGDLDSRVEDVKHITSLTEKDLRRCFMVEMNGGSICYRACPSMNTKTGDIDSGWGFQAWAKTERWWLISLFSIAFGYRPRMLELVSMWYKLRYEDMPFSHVLKVYASCWRTSID